MSDSLSSGGAQRQLPLGLRGACRSFARDIRTEFGLIRTLFRRNFLHRFAGSGLGIVWVVVMPCLPVFIYNLLQLIGVFTDPGDEIPHSVFLSFGIIVYFAFSETINQVAAATAANRNYIVESGVPKMAIVLSICGEVVANLLIRFGVFIILTAIVIGGVPWTVVFMPLLALPLVVLGLSLGLVLNLFTVLYRDLSNILSAVTFYLLFASGVFTVLPDDRLFFRILSWSPIYRIIEGSRAICLEGDLSHGWSLLLAASVGVVLFPFALVAFYRAERMVNSYL